MRTILIPTDFSVESLKLVEYACLNYPNTKLDIIMLAGYKLPETRWSIGHYCANDQARKFMNDSFVRAKRRLILEHKSQIEQLSFEVFTGVNSFAFQNFLSPFKVEDAIVPSYNSLYCAKSKWFDTTNFIKKNIKTIVEVPLEQPQEVAQRKPSLISLFN